MRSAEKKRELYARNQCLFKEGGGLAPRLLGHGAARRRDGRIRERRFHERSITGWIGKFNRAAYEIRTPILVTIGVRGTDHEVTQIPPGDPRGERGEYDKVNEGKAFMRSGNDVVEVPPRRAVFTA